MRLCTLSPLAAVFCLLCSCKPGTQTYQGFKVSVVSVERKGTQLTLFGDRLRAKDGHEIVVVNVRYEPPPQGGTIKLHDMIVVAEDGQRFGTMYKSLEFKPPPGTKGQMWPIPFGVPIGARLLRAELGPVSFDFRGLTAQTKR